MKTKRLLNLGMMLACGLSIQAQTPIFHEGFDAEQSKQPTDVAYYEYINTIDGDERNLNTTDAFAGAGCLNFFNTETNGNWWQRAVKFRNLPLEEGKSYRLTFRFKGSNTWMDLENNAETKSKMSVALMQGGEDADIPLLDANGNEFRYELSYFNPEQYEKYTKMFYFASAQLQKDTYAEKNPDKEPLADKWFATFNVYNPGDYYLDEVDLSESPIAAVNFAYEAIRVDFGYATNITDLVKQNPLGRVIMPNDCATVKINGEDVAIAAVELQSDGYMYIFLDNYAIEDEAAKVEIAFKNPADEAYQVKYSGNLAPEGAVPDFTDNSAEYLEAVSEAISWAYTEPQLVSTVPTDGSFGLAETTDEVSFTFDKPVKTTTAYGDPLEAKLNGAEDLVLKTTDESGEGVTTLTFGRQDGKTFTKGNYSITLSGIASTKEIESYKTFTLDFETGKMQIAETVYTDLFTTLLEGANGGQPTGWTIMVGGENWTGGTPKDDNGSACRNMTVTDKNGTSYTTFYLCDRDGYTYMQYGDKEDARLTLPAGNIEFSIMGLGHEAATRTLEFRLEDMDGNEVVKYSGETSVQAENFNTSTIEAAGAITTKFNNPKEQNFILKIHEPQGGFTAARVLGFKARSYEKTAGESTEAEVILEDKSFGGANGIAAEDNGAPKAGSGWALWQANDDGNGNWKKEAGKDYNYSGTRIFKLSTVNLPVGYYTNGNWPNTYAIYGNEVGEGDVTEPMLKLESGRYQITYYAANWKENGANKGKDHIVYFQLAAKEGGNLIYEREDKITNCDLNGDRAAAVTAKQVQFTVNISTNDFYTIKVGGTTEQFIGNFKIEKLGSQTAYYIGLIKSARELAIAEYDLCADAKYDGTAKTALKELIDKYADPSDLVHTPSEVNAVVEEIKTATADMATRREYIGRYDTAKQNAANLLAEVGEVADDEEAGIIGHPATKYAQLDAFKNLEAVYQKYSENTAQELENPDLVYATQEMENNTTLLKNLRDKGIGLLTKQIVDAAAALVKLDSEAESNEYVIAAGNALTDDQTIAKNLKLRITKAIYDKLANGEELFSSLDPDLGEEVIDSIDLSSFIQNANLYTTELDASKNLTDAANLPGWTVNITKGTAGLQWGWSAWDASQYNPINDQFLIAGWFCEWDLSQVITYLPVGKYTYVSGTMDSGFRDDTNDDKKAAMETRTHWTVTGNKDNVDTTGEIFSYIYWQSGEQRDSIPYNVSNIGQWYEFSDCVSKQFAVPSAGESQTGEATIGTCAISYNASAAADKFRLYMVGKDDTFDYAAAAKKVADEIETDVVEIVTPEGEPMNVSFYDLAGKKVNQPQGITIKVETYKNGFIKATKVLVK